MRPLSTDEIELAAKHAAEATRLQGTHEQQRRELQLRHLDEFTALRNKLGIPDPEPEPRESMPTELGQILMPLLAGLFSGLRAPAQLTTDVIIADPFIGPVTPPADAAPGVPIALNTAPVTPVVIPPPASAPVVARSPLPGTGTHPGCTLAAPCEKHGGAAMASPGAVTPPAQAVPVHYDGRDTPAPIGPCTMFKPCKECIERSRRPTVTVVPRTA